MGAWENFFIAEVSASAALTGLIFVSVSINLQRIMSYPTLPNRALEGLLALLAILITSSLALAPGQPHFLLGSEFLVVGGIVWLAVTVLQARDMRKMDKKYRGGDFYMLALSQIALLPFIIGGVLLIVDGLSGLYWLLLAAVFATVYALTNAWVLLVEINR